MDFGKLFQSVEDAVYEVMVWLLLLPKTLFNTIFHPRWSMKYVSDEWDKKPDDRFDEYLSPVLLWLLVSVIPLTLLAMFDAEIISGSTVASATEGFKKFSDKLTEMTLYAMIIPFIYIIWMEMVNKQPIKKSTLKRSFYLHCFALAPAQLLTVLFIALAFAFPIFSIVGFVILPSYEAFVFQSELETSYMKAFMYTLLPQIFLVVIIGIFLLSY